MSAHYSKFGLNTYSQTPYFQTHMPEGFPIGNVLIAARAYRNLPPNIQELAGKAKQWAKRVYANHAFITDIERWYDEEGNELDPSTGEVLTDEQIKESWEGTLSPDVKPTRVKDIPIPKEGFADPATWMPPPPALEVEDDSDAPSEKSLLADIKARGREYTGRYYGVLKVQVFGAKSDQELAQTILKVRAERYATPSPQDSLEE